jgi:hypothetical protein
VWHSWVCVNAASQPSRKAIKQAERCVALYSLAVVLLLHLVCIHGQVLAMLLFGLHQLL